MATIFTRYQGKLMNFNQFVMSEGIAPKKTSFGYDKDASNSKLMSNDGQWLTFVKIDGNAYVAMLSGPNFGFATSTEEEFDANYVHLRFRGVDRFMDIFDDNPTNTKSALRVFNKIFYVAIQMVEQTGREDLIFSAATRNLESLYSKMVKNKSFLSAISKMGWAFNGQSGDEYKFSKPKNIMQK